MTHTVPRATMPSPVPHPVLPHDVTTPYSTHLARCGGCGQWLHVDEDELITSLDEALLCWNCGVTRPGDALAPA